VSLRPPIFPAQTDTDIPSNSPLSKPELDVLRAQYEKEGDMVGVQTKFNYAWVRPLNPLPPRIPY